MEGRWRVELFGGLRVAGSRGVERFRTQKTGFLLAYLACHAGQRCPREVLGELLWPEADPAAARARLRGDERGGGEGRHHAAPASELAALPGRSRAEAAIS